MEVQVAGAHPLTQNFISRNYLYNLIKNGTVTKHTIAEYILNMPQLRNISKTAEREIKKEISIFSYHFEKKWKQSARHYERFEKKNVAWLQGRVNVNLNIHNVCKKMGRPEKGFAESSKRTKLRKVKPILAQTNKDELTYATQVSLNKSGKRDAALVLKEITQTSPTRATKIKRLYKSPLQKPVPYSPEKALALYVNAKMSKNQYKLIRKHARLQKCNIYPSYDKLLKAKQDCYPANESIMITETSAEIKLQSLLDHTTKRLAISQEEVLSQYVSDVNGELTFIHKWGCDGSSNQKEYKQAFSEEFLEISDSNLFAISIVPVQLQSTSPRKMILGQNPVPSSTRFCRPIKFLMRKETPELTKTEVDLIQNQIRELSTTTIFINDQEVRVRHQLLFTMVDGKVCSSLTNISGQKCFICGASPKEMNNPTMFRKKIPDTENYSFGLSTLHAYIRFLECILHIAYRLDIEKWQARSPEEKESVKRRKNNIIHRFRAEMGLLLDQTKQGTGTTNDGNSARRFFKDAKHSANITGVNEDLIHRFATILSTMSSGLPINIENFDTYTRQTCDLYLNLYPWYYMPSSVHKILIHGSAVIQNALLPIGQLSEEAQESRNKDLRNFREKHTRKISRKSTNEDLLHILLITSDPIISQIISIPRKKGISLSPAVLHLLSQPSIIEVSEENSLQENSSSSDSSSDSD